LFPTTSFIRIAQNLRRRISVSSNELDIYKTIDATLNKGGWFTPVYGLRQVLPEYLFLVDRTSYRDHQAKLAEEITNHLVQNGVFITIYYFDDDPRVCFSSNSISPPKKLHEIAVRYPQHRLIIISDAEKFFDVSTGEVEAWVNQTTTWNHRAILTPKPVETWGYQELALAREFVVLPATLGGLHILGQVFYQGTAIFTLSEDNPVPLPEPLRIRPYRWIERNPPPFEQIDIVLELGQHNLAVEVFDEFRRLIKETKTRRWFIVTGIALAVILTLLLGVYYYPRLISGPPEPQDTPTPDITTPSSTPGITPPVSPYFGSCDAGTYNVFVASGYNDYDRALARVQSLRSDFPQFRFELWNTVAPDGVTNQQFAVVAGHGLNQTEAQALVRQLRSAGVATDAYFHQQSVTSDCNDLSGVER
jgi:hypothetical protein